MPKKLTSDVRIDKEIANAMSPVEPVPFEDLLAMAQKTLDYLKKSLFFRRFVEQKMRENGTPYGLRIARSSSTETAELLIITPYFQIKFMHSGLHNATIYSFGERGHNAFLLEKSRSRLESMHGSMNAMRYLISRFGAPSFTAEEVLAETTQNGKLTIIEVRSFDSERPHDTDTIKNRLRKLQFNTEVKKIIYTNELPIPRNGEFIIILYLGITQADSANQFLKKLTPEGKKRLWISPPKGAENTEHFGYDPALLRPKDTKMLNLPDIDLLNLLNDMFSSPK